MQLRDDQLRDLASACRDAAHSMRGYPAYWSFTSVAELETAAELIDAVRFGRVVGVMPFGRTANSLPDTSSLSSLPPRGRKGKSAMLMANVLPHAKRLFG